MFMSSPARAQAPVSRRQPSSRASFSLGASGNDDTESSTDCDMSVALDYASDDDEAGVFFGAHNPVERKIAASLSRSIPASPASCSLAALAAGPGSGSGSGSASSSVGPRAPRRSSIRFKRDSCEVLRRRTPADDKEDEAGPSRLAQSHVHDRTPTPEDDTMEDGMFLDDADTDKENSIVPDPYYGSDVEDEYSPAEVEEAKPITLGFHGRQDDIASGIDMGGLTLLDIDDPDVGPLEDTSIAVDSEDASLPLSPSPLISALVDPFLDSLESPRALDLDNPFVTHSTPRTSSSRPSLAAAGPSTPLKFTPRSALQLSPETSANTSYDSELDSPIVARGVVVPVFSIVSPHGPSPLRVPESRTALGVMDPASTLDLPPLDDPLPLPSATPRRVTPSLAPLPKTPASAIQVRPSRRVPASDRPAARAIPASATAAERADKAHKAEARARERAQAIRGQLDFMVASKMRSFAPPASAQKAVPASVQKAAPASVSKRPLAASVSAPTRQPPPVQAGQSVSAPARMHTSPAKTRPVTGIPVPKKATKATTMPRSILKRPAAASSASAIIPVPAAAAPTPVLKPITVPINVPAPAPASPVRPLKRPFSAIERPATSTVAVRSGLGMSLAASLGPPSRPIRSPMASAGRAVGVVFAPTVPPSPARRDAVGRLTPNAQRIGSALRGTPAGALGTPSRTGVTPRRPTSRTAPTPTRAAPSSASTLPARTTPLRHPVSQRTAPLLARLSEGASEPGPEPEPEARDDDVEMAGEQATKGTMETQDKMEVDAPVEAAVEAAPADEGAADEPPAELAQVSEAPAPVEPTVMPEATAEAHAEAAPEPPTETADDAPPSPTPTGRRRSTRTRTPAPAPAPKPKATPKPPAPSSVPGVSERELKTATQKNTLRNQVYMCTIDRQIVRMSGPRPPSPTGKIPKASRKRAGPEAAVEKMVLAKGAGEDEEFVTPPRKRARTEKGVRWDREATLIRAPLGGLEGEDRPATTSSSSALKAEQVPLDAHGNVLERPVEKLKRNKVTVRAVFYDGENPVEFDYNAPPGSTKSKKK